MSLSLPSNLTEGYWNCDTCTFTDVAGYEIHEPSANLKTSGVGLIGGAAGVFVLWVVVKIVMWVVFPEVTSTFAPVRNNWENSDDWASQARRRRKPVDIRRWVRSKQWMAGSPIPRAYSPHDDLGEEIEKYYGNRDGLQKVDEEDGGNVPRTEEMPPEEEEDEVPDYWHQWNEVKKVPQL